MNLTIPPDLSSATISDLLKNATDGVLFLGDPRVEIQPFPAMFQRFRDALQSSPGLAYSDSEDHPRIDYQLGSIRDNFDFGPVIAIDVNAARKVWRGGNWRWGGLYDLRLRLSERYAIKRVPEVLYAASVFDKRTSGEKQFDYVDPRNRDYQIEMEQIATEHLRRIDAWLAPEFIPVSRASTSYCKKGR